MNGVVIKTERLLLRPPTVQDLERCADLLGDYEVAKMLARVPHPYDLKLGRSYLSRAAESWLKHQDAEELVFQIDHEGQMIGGLSFKELRETPEIGYWLGRPYWGKGFMSEAVEAAIAWLFQNTHHTRIASEVMTENPASLNVMEKLGFREVGEIGCTSLSRGDTMRAVRTELRRADFMNGR